MLLWVLLLGGLALAAAALGLVVAMGHAERRARRTLFRALGLPEETVELLMSRNGDVLAELSLVRRHDVTAVDDRASSEAEPEIPRAPAPIRLVPPPASSGPVLTPPSPDAVLRSGPRRRLRLPGRQGRP